ncbi:putative Chemotaxis regulator CheZ [Nitrospira sp. KM1]|nr:putative Chemotaxis regulator CheZ [Nitrospira sp. KM1]
MGGIVEQSKLKLYSELGELARFIDTAMRKLSEVGGPMASSSAQLPQAAAHLNDLNKMTEEGTHEVMRLTELIQDSQSALLKDLLKAKEVLEAMDCPSLAGRLTRSSEMLTENDRRLVEIMTALSFQDLVAQRVKKLVTILDDVQHKLMELVVVFGLEQHGSDSPSTGKADEMLKQLEASKSMAMKQDLADEILSEFGFK